MPNIFKRNLSNAILALLMVGSMVPALFWAIISAQSEAARVEQRFSLDISSFTQQLQSGLSQPLWDLTPEAAEPLLSAQFRDERLADLRVFTDLRQLFFSREESSRRRGHCQDVRFSISHQAKSIGEVSAVFCDGSVQDDIRRRHIEMLVLIGSQLAFTVLLMLWLLHRRLVTPVRRLERQANAIAAQELGEPFYWERSDEIGQVGRALEATRQALRGLFARLDGQRRALENELEQKEKMAAELTSSHSRYRSLINDAPEGIALLALDSMRFLEANPKTCRLLGLSASALSGMRPFDSAFVVESESSEAIEALWHHWVQEAATGLPCHFLWRVNNVARQARLYIDVHLCLIDAESPPSIRVTLLDVTEQVMAERQLNLVSRAVEQSHDGIAILDETLTIRLANPAFSQLFNTGAGQQAPIFARGTEGDHMREALLARLRDVGEWESALWLAVPSGGSVYCLVRINRIVNVDEPDYYICIVTDTTESKTQEDRIRYLAHHDPVTGLANRNFLYGHVNDEIHRCEARRGQFALGFIDLDRFKRINDSLGHAAGDLLLQTISERLRQSLRQEDLLARLGGDEFVVMLPGVGNQTDATEIFNRIMAEFEPVVTLEGSEFHISASIGICFYPQDGDSADTLMRNADTAMYVAKSMGRNNFQFFMPTMYAQNAERLDLERDMRRGVQENQFVPFYQPKVNAKTGEIVGAEALIRWHHPTLGLVSPARFLGLAEETGLIVDMGRQILLQSCIDCLRWRQEGHHDFMVAVNVSERQFSRSNLLETVQACLDETGLPAGALELEITESLLMLDVDRAIETVAKLKSLGVTIALDDFGTGYSSLSYLQKFPIDHLKIDKSFIQHIDSRPGDVAITQAIVALSHGLGIRVIAEGVETSRQNELLVGLDCDYIQGYLYSPPVPAVRFEEMLKI